MGRLWQINMVESKHIVLIVQIEMKDYIWKVEVLSDFYAASLPEYWQLDSYPPDRKLEEISPLNLISLREKDLKIITFGSSILIAQPDHLIMNPTVKKPYHGQRASNQLESAYFSLRADTQESPGNEGNLLLESKTKSFKEEKKPLEETETLQEKED